MAGRPGIDDARQGRRLGAVIIFLVGIGGVVLTLLARSRWWFPPAASRHGADVDQLITITFIITGLVFVLVHVLLGVFVWRFVARGEERAAYWYENRTLELTYTLVPAAVLITLISMGAVVWGRVHSPAPADRMIVNVHARQFGWMFRYAGPDGAFGRTDGKFLNTRQNPMGLDPADAAGKDDVVTRELHVVLNRPVEVTLNSTDVLHSFFLPNFRVKQDVVPGMTTTFWFVPTQTGTFELACAELCGVGHYIMRSQIVVEASQQALEAWLASQRK